MRLALLILIASVWPGLGATLYVRTTGNDTTGNGLTTGTAWLTLDKALSYASLAAGDVIDIGAGSFASAANTDVSGSSGNPIVIQGAGKGITFLRGKLTIDQRYYTVRDLTMDGHTDGGSYTGNYISLFGPNCQQVLLYNIEFTRNVAGAFFQDVGGAYPTNVTVRGCEFHHPTGNGMVAIVGDSHVVEQNWFRDSSGNDAVRVFGPNHIIRSNRFTRIVTPSGNGWTNLSTTSVTIGTGTKTFTTASGMRWTVGDQMDVFSSATPSALMRGFVASYSGTTLQVDVYSSSGSGTFTDWRITLTSDGNHADVIQSFKDSNNHPTTNLLFTANLIEDCTSQFGNIDSNPANDLSGAWLVSNNIFTRSRIQLNCYLPEVKFYNNTVYDTTGWTTGIRAAASSGTRGNADGMHVLNNLFVRIDGAESGGGAVSFNAALTGCFEDYNLFTDLTDTDFTSLVEGPHSINGGYSPAQIFVDAGNGNFQLTNTFTAGIGTGTNLLSVVPVDFTGAARSSTFDFGALAAGSSSGGGDVLAPTLSSASCAANGVTWTFIFSEAVSFGAGGASGFTATMDSGAVTFTYSSGSGSTTITFSGSRTVYATETGTLAYTQPGNGVEDSAGNDLATFAGHAVINNSTQTAPAAVSSRFSPKFRNLRAFGP